MGGFVATDNGVGGNLGAEQATTPNQRKFVSSIPDVTPKLPTTQNVTVPDVDPSSGTATGYSTDIETKLIPPSEDYPDVLEMPLFKPAYQKGKEVNAPVSNKLAARTGLLYGNTVQGRINSLQSNLPTGYVSEDKYGNPLWVQDNQKYHIDRPGSVQGPLTRTAAQTITAAPVVAGSLALLPETAPWALTAGMGAVANTGASLVQDIVGDLAGTKEQPDIAKAGISGLMGFGVPAGAAATKWISQIGLPEVWSQLPAGTKNWAMNFAKKIKSGDINVSPSHEADALLDQPEFLGAAEKIMDRNDTSSNTIENMLKERQNPANVSDRLFADMDTNLGPLNTTERAMDQTLKTAKKAVGNKLTPALDSAGPLDVSSVVGDLDTQLETAKGSTAAALQKIRKMLVLDDGSPAVTPQRVPITDPTTGKIVRYEMQGAAPETPPIYETNAQALENARLEIDRLIKYGDETLGVKPNSFPSKDHAVANVRKGVSGVLKNDVAGYSDFMDEYSDIYSLLKANELGTNIFKRGANSLNPEQVNALLADPATGAAFKTGARGEFENVVRRSPNDAATLNKVTGGEGDYVRDNLYKVFGQDPIDNISAAAQRELHYQNVADSLLSRREAARKAAGAQSIENIGQGLLPEEKPVEKAYSTFLAKPVNYAVNFTRGQTGPRAYEGAADVLTKQGPQISEFTKALEQAAQQNKNINAIRNVGTGVSGTVLSQPPLTPDENRMPRANGGSVIDKKADALINETMRNQKLNSNHTEHMLSMPDDAIVQALNIAKQVAA